ncbi:SNF2-related protein [Paenibacillus septentrionalis]|uniref:SNF2-related protein n=1 Tax=Paenibacillus septentrionalis TaxID=429342 RepID=UPI003624E4F1
MLYNWEQELRQFAPTLKAAVLEANQFQHKEAREKWIDTPIWIVSYQTLRMQLSMFASFSFETIICDEAQAFKNDYTKTSQALRQLTSTYRFALTGTPIGESSR